VVQDGGSVVKLEPRLPPSRRRPEGAARCQATTKRDGVPRQCKRKARDGFATCGHHGAGFRKRELEGRAENPALAPLKSGRRAKESTMEQLWKEHPELRVLYDQHLEDDDLLDMRPVLAKAKSIASWMIENLQAESGGDGSSQAAFRAIQALSGVMRTAHDLMKIEERLGPVSRAEIARLTHGVAETLQRFVPPGDQPEAFAYLRKRIAR